MSTNEEKRIIFFDHTILKYNTGDIAYLRENHGGKAGPLLLAVMNGIDLIGGFIYGFYKTDIAGNYTKNGSGVYVNNSKKRSCTFMTDSMGLTLNEATVLYEYCRCGMAHEGSPKEGVFITVKMPGQIETDMENTGQCFFVLEKNEVKTLWLYVPALAKRYIDAVETVKNDKITSGFSGCYLPSFPCMTKVNDLIDPAKGYPIVEDNAHSYLYGTSASSNIQLNDISDLDLKKYCNQ